MSEATPPAMPVDGGLSAADIEAAGEELRFTTTLHSSSLLGLSLKNGLLNIVTLTLWRFWGKTEVRRRIWSAVRMNNDSFEYTGRGIELFLGFLIALGVLGLPFLLVVFGAQFLEPGWMFAILLPLYIFMFWLFGFGIFTAFRYMASRTTWRGIRFRLGGSATSYGGRYLLYLFLTGVTLGWFQPEAHRGLAEHTWNGLNFGTRRIRFRMDRAHRENVYGAFAIGWFGQIVGYVVILGAFMAIIFAAVGLAGMTQTRGAPAMVAVPVQTAAEQSYGAEPSSEEPLIEVQTIDTPPPAAAPTIILVFGGYAALLLALPLWFLVWAPYHAAILRSITAGIGVDDARFKLDLKAMPLWWLTVTNLFFLLITLGFLMPWVQARTVKFLVERLSSSGPAQLDKAQQTDSGPRTGEGLADAFGFSVI